MPAPHPPVIFLTFANDRSDRARYLRNLPDELRRIRERIESAEAQGLCEVVVRTNATVGELLDVFQDPRYRDRIALFHFGGHAGDYQLLLESASGAPALAHADGLAAFLGQQRGLQLVFLNGCSTQPQLEGLQRAGIPAVVATAEAISDAVATELSARFYAGLASGLSLQAAYDEAVAAVRVQHGGTDRGDGTRSALRDMVRDEAVDHADRWPWALHVRDGAEGVRTWSLPRAAGNPLFGLPPLPEMDLPETPYRHLKWFREEDAEVFFGRGREIRDLHERVTEPSGAPILLFYGQSGVGKSSLLAAGLGPRLSATHEVRVVRRDRERELTGTLAAALEADRDELAAAWRAEEAGSGLPLVVILDQVEEVYTRPGDPGELADFLRVLTDLFADRAGRPEGKLVLAFRKEWLADLEARLSEARLPRSKVYLERLDRDGIVEVVNGPTRTERLGRQYGLTVEDRLGELIADDLLSDREAPVAPTLEILLTKMWERATRADPDAPAFTIDLYQQLKRDGLLLDDFLGEQLAALRDWNAEVVDSGLALDVLAYHTTPLGTAERRTQEELDAAYDHRRDVLPDLLQQSEDRYLLVGQRGQDVDGAEAKETRLAHDTLAPLVRQRYKDSDKPGQRAERILTNRAADWRDGEQATTLDRADLATVEAGQAGMQAWDDAKIRLIEASRKERTRRERNRKRLIAAGVVALLVILGSAGFAWQQRSEAIERERTSLSQALAARALNYLDSQVDLALLLSAEATRVKETVEARDALLSSVQAADLQADRMLHGHEGPVRSIAFSPDGRSVATAGEDGMVRLYAASTGTLLDERRAGGRTFLNTVFDVAFSPGGDTLVAVSQGGQVDRWAIESQQLHGEAASHEDDNTLNGARISPDARSVALWLYESSYMELCSIARAGPCETRWRANGTLPGQPFRGDGRSVIITRDDAIQWVATETGTITAEIPPPPGTTSRRGPTSTSISPDGHTLAFGLPDGRVQLWSVSDPVASAGEPWGEPLGQADPLAWAPKVVFNPSGDLVAWVDHEVRIEVWGVAPYPYRVTEPLGGHEGAITSLAFSPDSRYLASGGDDGTVLLRSFTDRSPGLRLRESLLDREDSYIGNPARVAFAPDGKAIAVCDNKRVFSVRSPEGEGLYRGTLPHSCDAVIFSPDGRVAAIASSRDTMRVLIADSEELRSFSTYEIPFEGDAHASALAFSANGDVLAAGGDRGVLLWSFAERRSLTDSLLDGRSPVLDVTFAPDDKRLFSAHSDGTVRSWSVESGQLLNVHLENVRDSLAAAEDSGLQLADVTLSPDGRRLTLTNRYAAVSVWDVETEKHLGDPLPPEGVLTGEGSSTTVLRPSITFRPNNQTILLNGADGSIRTWSIEAKALASKPLAGDRWYPGYVLSGDGQTLAWTAGAGIGLWSMEAGQTLGDPLPVAEGRRYPPTVLLALSQGGEMLVSVDSEGTWLWDLRPSNLRKQGCEIAGRNLSAAEWAQFVGDRPYACTCQNAGPGEGAGLESCTSSATAE